MLIEELLALPVGTLVFGELQIKKVVPGVVTSMKDGAHFIRWADGYVTFPFGWIRDYDEYIAARTETQLSRRIGIPFEPDGKKEQSGPSADWEFEQAIPT